MDSDEEYEDEPLMGYSNDPGISRSKRRRRKDRSYEPNKSDDDDSTYDSDENNKHPGKDYKSGHSSRARTNFTNALLKVGTKSTKDSTLDKPVRKSPGLLLETAGRSLMQKASNSNSLLKTGSGGSSMLSSGATVGGLSFGLASSKISFGLYGGHLPVDHGSYTKTEDEDDSNSADNSSADAMKLDSGGSSTNKSEAAVPRQKVFSNWGGEFFKKNLDYRANTNKILEKMNMKSNGANDSGGGLRSILKTSEPSSSKRSLDSSGSSSSPSKKLKSSFFNYV